MRKFTLEQPHSIREAIDLLSTRGSSAKLIAGGTDLLIEIKNNKRSPDHVISLRNIPELDKIVCNDRELRIGSMVTLHDIERSDVVKNYYPLLADAASYMGSIQVRNIATIGGNICNGTPSADTAAPLLAMGVKLLVEGPGGRRSIPIDKMFVSPGKTSLAENEIVTAVVAPVPEGPVCSRYIKFSRRQAMDLPLLGVAVVIFVDLENKLCREARIALSLAGPVPKRSGKAEDFVAEKPFSREIWEKAGDLAESESECRTSFRTTAEYRQELIRVLIPRAAREALRQVNISM